jgi:predicted Rossmann fold flavoprotein
MEKHIVIIGGGAAGYFAAVNLKEIEPHCRVTILEKGNKVLSKVRVSGGGRCNVTHACFDNALLVKHYPRGAKALIGAFSRFSTTQTVEWFKTHGVALKTEDDLRMFPESNSSETIVECLSGLAQRLGVELKLGAGVKSIQKEGEGFLLLMSGGGSIRADYVLIACGGNPRSDAYDWLKNLGHAIVPPVPSLFTFNLPENQISKLMGLSVPNAGIRIDGFPMKTSGPLLITHWGFSGPAVLKLSAWAARELNDKSYDFTIRISWNGDLTEEDIRIRFSEVRMQWNTRQVAVHPLFDLPKRLWEHLVAESGIASDLKWADLPKKNMNKLVEKLINDTYLIKGKTTYKEEFVTCGGIALSDVDFRTMESRKCKGLYFAGEVLDIDGITGGFNFQSAWTTGWIGAQTLALICKKNEDIVD